MKGRLLHALPAKLLFLFGYGALALALSRLGARCLFRQFLGVSCPGCGMTRAVLRLLQLDFAGAAAYHPMVFALPIMVLYFLLDGKLFGKRADAAVWTIIGAGFLLHWLKLLVIAFS